MEDKKTRVAVNVFVLRGNELLLGKRKNTAGDGDWGLPGGHLEYQESLVEGAKRELLEETGLNANLVLESVVNDPLREEDTHYLHINFLAKDVSGEPELKEPGKCYEWGWFSLNDLPDNIFIGHKKIIPAFLNKINFVD